jgi:hypothetical protein
MPTPTASATPLPPLGQTNARQVADKFCPGGMGWEWLEEVDDGSGHTNLVKKAACAVNK